MHHEVILLLPGGHELHVDVAPHHAMDSDAARRWLDAQFTALDCEPLRPSGKLLLADKVLVVARAAQHTLVHDSAWRQQYASAVAASLGKPLVRVDVVEMTVGF